MSQPLDALLAAVTPALGDPEVARRLRAGDTTACVEVVDAGGLIVEFTVMVRPLSGLVALQTQMAPRFGARPVGLTPLS